MATPASYQKFDELFSDVSWRLNNLYWIKDKEGNVVKFKLNEAQAELLGSMHYLNIILKARQLGFTTFIDCFILDACIFNSHTSGGIIAHNLEDAKVIFRDKVKFPYDNLDEDIKQACPAVLDSANTLTFGNGSSLRVGASLRSGTYQYLHISEHGKICAKYPDKAREVKTGALNTVAAGQFVFIESTAEGREGDFYDMTQEAIRKKQEGRKLTPLDFKFHFFAWWKDPANQIDPDGVVLSIALEQYFELLKTKYDIELSAEQKAWYAKKSAQQGDDMKREHPSHPDEAFEASVEGAYFAREMAIVRTQDRICKIPLESKLPVNTFWDLGVNDDMTIWLHQMHQREHRFVRFFENSGEGFVYYKRWLDDWAASNNVAFGTHFAPHDIEVRNLGEYATTRREIAAGIGLKFETVDRVKDINDAINAVRNVLNQCWFDEKNAERGIIHLDSYRKEWDDRLGVWKDKPRHDQASHGASAFMTFALANDRGMIGVKKPRKLDYSKMNRQVA